MPIKKSQKARREPSQERSRKLNEYILEAAAQVLEKDGPFKFTTLKIAQKAGISIGSLYQYYANKEAPS
jgi:AcrR family transcriptional regulator